MTPFLSCDWGTTTFRLRLVDAGTGKVIQEVSAGHGIAATYNAWVDAHQPERIPFYKKILRSAIGKVAPNALNKDVPIIISGMASSSLGIKELPYAKFPLNCTNASQLIVDKIEPDEEFTHPIFLVSGCMTTNDIMRGEETILLGCDLNEKNEGIYIFPGTHSKHIIVGKVMALDFKTYVTGELFSLLEQKSILSNSVSKGGDEEAFLEGIAEAQNKNILNSIFSIRAKHILHESSPVKNHEYLSGLIIGTELKELTNSSTSIYVVSEDPLMKAYELALRGMKVGKKIYCISANRAFINGQCKVLESIGV